MELLPVDATEEMTMDPDALPSAMRGWRCYRIEYGGCNEDCIYEGRVMLPPQASPDALVQLIMGMQAYEKIWATSNACN